MVEKLAKTHFGPIGPIRKVVIVLTLNFFKKFSNNLLQIITKISKKYFFFIIRPIGPNYEKVYFFDNFVIICNKLLEKLLHKNVKEKKLQFSNRAN